VSDVNQSSLPEPTSSSSEAGAADGYGRPVPNDSTALPDCPSASQASETSETIPLADLAAFPVTEQTVGTSDAQLQLGQAKPVSAPGSKAPAVWTSSAQSLLMTIVIAVFVITFAVQAFQIPSESMERTLLVGDYLLVDKSHYGPSGTLGFLMPYRPIRRGDIVVFHYPVKPSEHFVKRVIGLPGDHVHLERKRVYVNGKPLAEPYVRLRRGSFDGYRDNFPATPGPYDDVTPKWFLQMRMLVHDGELVVPADSYFVLGDNRDNSLDSRYWGLVPRENVIGRPLLIYWSAEAACGADSAEAAPQDGKLSSLRPVFARWLGIRWRRILHLVE
jgi:signal peptidase I